MRVFIFIFLYLLANISYAQCYGQHAITFQPVLVHEGPGQTMGNAYAIANWAPNGWPYIIYGPRFYQLPNLMKEFVMIHECAHLSIPTSDEVQVNCVALTDMRNRGLTLDQERKIKNWTVSEGAIGYQYGGTGYNFWQLTLQCAGPR